ncbi:VWA domain-containing protein [Porticoccus sp. W117]|uniref:vWA domain-containing protein n=1 Tax=Porticoccus sp. W117 TaxID=3054777 RepID=UPI002596AB25|nr:VWA domain-containing protein [Porticoccus sp. W117]MDM3870351.1 VWA domain-containing protein [Porticoccus sp. W117]
MTFSNLSSITVISGLLVCAGILYALQWLRIRHRQKTVATMLFWRQAITDAPVKTFWEKFHYWWFFLLSLLICSLIWLAVAGPQWDRDPDANFTVLVLDGSAGMAKGDRFQQAVSALQADLSELPENRRQVVWAGAAVATLLHSGEHELLLTERLRGRLPEAAPASIERYLRHLGNLARESGDVQVRFYGDAPLATSLLDSLPGHLQVLRVASPASTTMNNRGITALGVAEAQSGDWGKVDIYVRVDGTMPDTIDPPDIQITLGGESLDHQQTPILSEGGAYSFHLLDVPANGLLLTVAIGSDDFLLDDSASITLPSRKPVRVQLSASLDESLKTVLLSDPAIAVVENNADVVIRRQGESLGQGLPAIELVAAEQQQQAFVFSYPENLESHGDLAAVVQTVGLDQIDATGLAEQHGRPIEVSILPGEGWRLSMWQELIGPDYNLVKSRTFPLLMSKTIRWLAGTGGWFPYLAAGDIAYPRDIPRQGLEHSSYIDSVAPLVFPVAGEAAISDETTLAVSLLDSELTLYEATATLDAEQSAITPSAVLDLTDWLLLAALLLLAGEWMLYQRGRMP